MLSANLRLWTSVLSGLLWLALLGHASGVPRDPSSPSADPLSPEDFPCGERDVKVWGSIRDAMQKLIPRYSGRLNFVNVQGDVPFLDSVSSLVNELELPGEVFDPEMELPWRERLEWTSCHSGLLAVRILLVATKQTGRPLEVPDLATRLVASTLAAPWINILQSGWPIFKLLAMLSRWASPFLDRPGADLTSHGRSAQQRAISLRSHCDDGEVGATRQARELIGGLWRHLDPDVWRGNESVQAKPVEEALAGLSTYHSSSVDVPGQSCYWTRHPSGETSDASATAQVLAACAELPQCVGAMTDGAPKLLAELPLLASDTPNTFLLWCSPLVRAGESPLPCPLARAAGLLTTAYRRFGGPALS